MGAGSETLLTPVLSLCIFSPCDSKLLEKTRAVITFEFDLIRLDVDLSRASTDISL